MQKLITFITALLFSQFCIAQTQVTIIYNYTGAISKYPIEMQLLFNRSTDTVNGTYYYLKSDRDKELDVHGLKSMNNSLMLKETNFRYRDQDGKPLITGFFNLTGTDSLSGNWQHPKTGATLPIKLRMRENLVGLQPANYDFKLQTYKGKMQDAGMHERMYTKINQLDIYYKNQLHQRINGFDECLYDDRAEVIMEDLNFDGYLDLKVPIYFPERTKYDGSFIYFIYNKTSRQFEKNQQLIDMEYLNFDSLKKEVYRYDESSEGFITNYYKWKDGKLYLARTEKG